MEKPLILKLLMTRSRPKSTSVELSVSVDQLGKTSTIVAVQISGFVLQQCVQLTDLNILVEIALRFDVELGERFGSIVIDESMGHDFSKFLEMLESFQS